MTRKHFQLIADILSTQLCAAQSGKLKAVDAIGGIAWDLAEALKNENPRFNRKRFLMACGYGEEYIAMIDQERAA